MFLIKHKWSDPPRCSLKFHASIHQIKTFLRQKGQRFKTQRSRLHICVTAESRSSKEFNSLYGISVDWPLHYGKVLPINNYLIREIGTNKTQMLHRMPMRQLIPQQLPPDTRITPHEWKPDPEVSLKHDDLYARTWECEYKKTIFDAGKDSATPLNSPEIPVQSDLSIDQTWNTPGAAQECSREIFLLREELYDATNKYLGMEPDAETNSEQPNNSPTKPSSWEYNLHHNPKPNCNDNDRY